MRAVSCCPRPRGYSARRRRRRPAIDTLRCSQRKCIRVGAPGYSFEAPGRNAVLERFRQRHRDVEVEMCNGWTGERLAALPVGELDLAFALWPFDTDGLETLVIDRTPVYVVMPEDASLTA